MEKVKVFLKNNWFKISLIIIVIILLILVSLTTFYFYNLYRNNLDKTYLQQQTNNCAELSIQYIKNNYDYNSQSLSHFVPPSVNYSNYNLYNASSPWYHFNRKLNTCIIFVNVLSTSSTSNVSSETSTVRNLLTDELLMSSSKFYTDNKTATSNFWTNTNINITQDEWDKQKQELMSE